ncbi:MAG: hypothetical protein FWF06_00700, partial [Symbiobacteriaceae bacterium]|nr:hypothetical protein [Symbiobacteriaceae bacterium]
MNPHHVELPQLEEKLGSNPAQEVSAISLRVYATLLVCWILTALLVVPAVLPYSVNVEVNEPSPHDIMAPHAVIDRFETTMLQEIARRKVEPVLVVDFSIGATAVEELNKFLSEVVHILELYPWDETKSSEISTVFPEGWEMAPYMASSLAELTSPEIEDIRRTLVDIYFPFYQDGIPQEFFTFYRNQALDELMSRMGNHRGYSVAKGLMEQLIRVNMVVDEKLTQDARNEAAAQVHDVWVVRGESILRTGELVNERAYMLLEDLGMLADGTNWELMLTTTAGLGGLFFLLFVVLNLLAPEALRDPTTVTIFGAITIFTLALGRVVLYVSPENIVFIPVPAATLIIAVLFHIPLAVTFGIILSLMAGFLLMGNAVVLQLFLVGAIASVFGTNSLRQRTDLLWIGMRIGLAQGLVLLLQGATLGDFS